MAKVVARPGDNPEKLVKAFSQKCKREGLMSAMRKKEYYVGPSQKRKLKEEAARKAKAKFKRNG